MLEGDVLAARAYAVAYSFLSRVPGRVLRHPDRRLRLGGTAPLPPRLRGGDARQSSNSRRSSGLEEELPEGAVIPRPCICRRDNQSTRCGHCSFKAIVNSHIKSGGGEQDPILGTLMSPRATRRLRRRGASLGIERCSWHVFRRGAASDIMRSGGTTGFLMSQGGWRPGAFLKYLLASDVEDRRTLEKTAVGLDSDSD